MRGPAGLALSVSCSRRAAGPAPQHLPAIPSAKGIFPDFSVPWLVLIPRASLVPARKVYAQLRAGLRTLGRVCERTHRVPLRPPLREARLGRRGCPGMPRRRAQSPGFRKSPWQPPAFLPSPAISMETRPPAGLPGGCVCGGVS